MTYSVFTNEEEGICLLTSFTKKTTCGGFGIEGAAVELTLPLTASEAAALGAALTKAAEAMHEAKDRREMSPARRALEEARAAKNA